jgi:hypothetical protein
MKLPYLICGGIALVTGLFAFKSLCTESSPAASAVPNSPVGK